MDNQKDIDKGHKEMPKNAQEIRTYKGLPPIVGERHDGDMSFICSRTEKLATAVYMITDFLDSKEPMKWEMRDTAVSIMSFINSFSHGDFPHRNDVPHSRVPVFNAIKDMMSLLDFSSRISLVSEMNASILKKEYASLYRGIESRLEKGDPVGNPILPERFFDENAERARGKKQFLSLQNGKKNGGEHANGQATISEARSFPRSHGGIAATGGSVIQGANVTGPGEKLEEKPATNGYNPRRDVILNLLRTKKEVDIKDITGVISNCSEKTVQREIAALIDEGLVMKKGEKRWSKYTLVS